MREIEQWVVGMREMEYLLPVSVRDEGDRAVGGRDEGDRVFIASGW